MDPVCFYSARSFGRDENFPGGEDGEEDLFPATFIRVLTHFS